MRLAKVSIGVALVLLALALALPADAADSGTIAVTGNDGREYDAVSTAQLNEDVNRTYEVRSNAGTENLDVNGFSLAGVLGEAGVYVYDLESVKIDKPGGGSVELSGDEARNAGGIYPDGPPVIYLDPENGDVMTFLRPSEGGGDNNADDVFAIPGGTLNVTVTTSTEPGVEVTADPSEAEVGDTITFTANPLNLPNDGYSYSWSCSGCPAGGNFNETGPKLTRPFTVAGEYDVFARIELGTSHDPFDSAHVVIGEAERRRKKDPPDRQGGGSNEDSSDTGASDGSSEGGAGAGNGTGTYSGPPPATDAPPVETPTEPVPAEKTPKSKPVEPGLPEERVEGELLGSPNVTVLPAPEDGGQDEKEKDPSLQTGELQESGGAGIRGALLAGAVFFGVLGAGALAEAGPPLGRPRLPGLSFRRGGS
jgi:hypothetical protein